MAKIPDWGVAFLQGRHYAVLATLDEDGTPHLTPVWYLFRDAQLFVAAGSTSRKVRNVMARPTATLLVDVRRPGAERWVSGVGPVAIVRGEESQRLNRAIQERYLTPEALGDPGVGPVFAAADDVTLCLRPATWRSWSVEALDEQFFGGVLGAMPEKWFLPPD
jgi:PPOX class probable F420-dependent enzyme